MPATILELCRDVCDDGSVSIDPPETLFPARRDDNLGDSADQKLRRALTKTVAYLAGWDFQCLRREYVFTSMPGAVQHDAMPGDFLRFVAGTFWDRSRGLQISGPVQPQEWQAGEAWKLADITPAFTQRGGDLLIRPELALNSTVAYEYITSAVGWNVGRSGWATGSGSTAANWSTGSDGSRVPIYRFAADANVCVFSDDEMMRLGILAHYLAGEGMDPNGRALAEFRSHVLNVLKTDGAKRPSVPSAHGGIDATISAMRRSFGSV